MTSRDDVTESKSHSPLVTIGLPFSNEREDYFLLAVQSVFAQTYERWELILIADGASSDLLSIARSLDDPRIRVIEDGLRKGLPYRLNQLAREAKGEFLARMDSDDIMHPERLEASVAAFAQYPVCDVVSTEVFQIDDDGKVLGRFKHSEVTENRQQMFRVSPIVHPTVMTRVAWSRENPYDERFLKAQDKELWIRTISTENHVRVPRELLFYRVSRTLTFEKHRQTNRYDRRIVRAYGPTQIGILKTLVLLIRSHAKQVLFAILLKTGRGKALYERKYVDGEVDTRAADALELVLQSAVPIHQQKTSR